MSVVTRHWSSRGKQPAVSYFLLEKKIYFILNANARSGNITKIIQAVSKNLPIYSYSVILTSSTNVVSEVTSGLSTEDSLFIVLGGDGTFNNTIQNLTGARATFAVIPKGTANDLAASFGISQDVEKAVKIIAEGHTTLLDTIKVNSSHIVTIGSLGFPALVAKTVNDFKKTRPILKWIHRHILRSSIYSIFVGVLLVTRGVRALAYRGRVFADGKPVFTGSFTAIFFGKQEVLGKNFRPCPGMKHSDPHLRISILKFSGLWSTVRDIFHISKGHPERAHHLVQINANSFFIRTDGFMPLLGDGEILDTDDEFYGERMPGALRLVVPRSETSK